MYLALQIAGVHEKARECPGLGDGDWRSKAFDQGFGNPLANNSAGLSFRLSGRLALQKLQKSFHLGHHAANFSRFRQQAILHDALMHFPQLLADVAQVTNDLLALRLRHRQQDISLFPFTPWCAMPWQVRRSDGSQASRQAQHRKRQQGIRARQHGQHHDSREGEVTTHKGHKLSMENRGLEPLTSAVRSQRSTS